MPFVIPSIVNPFTRREILKRPDIAINYIAAIMNGYAVEAERSHNAYNIRRDPAILVTLYHGVKGAESLEAAASHFASKAPGAELKPNVFVTSEASESELETTGNACYPSEPPGRKHGMGWYTSQRDWLDDIESVVGTPPASFQSGDRGYVGSWWPEGY